MKKRVLSLGLLLLLILSVSANAAGLYSNQGVPKLMFTNHQAICSVAISETSSAKISATIKLWAGTDCIKAWTTSGTKYVFFSETAPAVKGKTYRLTVEYAVAGKTQPAKSVTKTYR